MSRSTGPAVLALLLLLVLQPGQAQAKLQQVTEDNWRDLLTGEWMVEL